MPFRSFFFDFVLLLMLYPLTRKCPEIVIYRASSFINRTQNQRLVNSC